MSAVRKIADKWFNGDMEKLAELLLRDVLTFPSENLLFFLRMTDIEPDPEIVVEMLEEISKDPSFVNIRKYEAYSGCSFKS